MIDTIVTGDLQVNTYLFNYKENKIVIIDPGSDSKKIISKIIDKKYIPCAVLLTHGHFDHIGATMDIISRWGIPLYIHTQDAFLVGSGAKLAQENMLASIGVTDSWSLAKYIRETPDPNFRFNDNDILSDFDLIVLHTPGHTRGSSCFYSKTKNILFTGDTLFKNGIGRTDLPNGDYQQIKLSLERLFKLPNDTAVFPGHGPETKIGNELNIMQ
jgi:hydroxyacylglutathione hydrolase